MSDMPADQGPGPASPPRAQQSGTPPLAAEESPPPAPPGGTAPLAAGHKRWRWKKVIPLAVPLLLAVIGLALLPFAFKLYPRTAHHSAPPFPTIIVVSSVPLANINYTVFQHSAKLAGIEISLELAGNVPHGGTVAVVEVDLPTGEIIACPQQKCTKRQWTGELIFIKHDTVNAFFGVRAPSFGVVTSDNTATAAIPEVYYHSSGRPLLYTTYGLPAANSYDWSSYPTVMVGKSDAEWEEALVRGDNIGRAAVGVNYAGQADDSLKTFIAGALVGLAGAAILAAIIEAVHVHDWEALRELRSK